ncbi:MAG: hypothetical protein A2622_00330 [Bdellovibrionales bacterium RIFCSPHIGHO2_01_FULL_40_29]|nr:MAG: hypothetical protein A2622_00330 [Bdellovibrionales bacterium RIFCSPHIGHO2_01_FULL_40_29]OFZ32571.1 MAG: hypothetical protein A3D17_04930 [Bdellovibrionales bacterium RIFCSPHIGHO2_02_FULL_40_15]
MKIFVAIIVIISTLLSCQGKPTRTDYEAGGSQQGFLPPPVWNDSMQNLKRDLVMLQPYIFDKKKFNDPVNKKFLSKSIHELAVDSQNVKHDPIILAKDPTARFVAAEFANEIKQADENFNNGWHEYSRSQLVKVTSYCLECHTRVKDGVEVRLQDSVEPYVNTLPIKDQIEFMVAFRQFDSAYKLAQQEMRKVYSHQDLHSDIETVSRLGFMVAVQYMQDKAKAEILTEALSQNKSIPGFLKVKNTSWRNSIQQWDSNETLTKLSSIRLMLKNKKSDIEDMRAIPALLRLLTDDLTPDELGEALLLTGESYESLNRVSMISLHENYYESCIRRVPQSKWAKTCFKNYQDSVTASYTGSGGTRLPNDVKQKLQTLKALIQ